MLHETPEHTDARVRGGGRPATELTSVANTQTGARRPSLDPVILILLVVSLVGNVVLAFRLAGVGTGSSPSKPSSAVGARVASMSGVSPDGKPISVSMAKGRKTVIFVYSPTCEWCKKTWPLFKQLADGQERFDFVAVCLGEPAEAFDAPFTVITRPSPAGLAGLKVSQVPETLVVSEKGTVERAWIGAYQGGQRGDIESFFGKTLK